MRTLSMVLTTLVLLLAGCEGVTEPGVPASRPAWEPAMTLTAEAPPAAGGALFLAPLGAAPSPGGLTDPAAAPVVEVCEDQGCEVLHARFDASGDGPERVRVASDASHHLVNWNTGATGAVAETRYWIRVLVNGRVAAATDLTLHANGTFRRGGSEVAGLVAGQTLPIRFRVMPGGDEGAFSVVVTPASLELPVMEGFQLQATVFDGSGGVVEGATVSWSVDREDRVFLLAEPFELPDGTVLEPGYVVGVSAGDARVTATWGGVSGSAEIRVLPAACQVRDSGPVRFGNLSPGDPVVDVAVDGVPLGLRLGFGQVSEYLEVSGCAFAYVDAEDPDLVVSPARGIFPAWGTGNSHLLVGEQGMDEWERIYTIAEDAGSGEWYGDPIDPGTTWLEPYHAAVGVGSLLVRLTRGGVSSEFIAIEPFDFYNSQAIGVSTGEGSLTLEIDVDFSGMIDFAFVLPDLPPGEMHHAVLALDAAWGVHALVLVPGGETTLVSPPG